MFDSVYFYFYPFGFSELGFGGIDMAISGCYWDSEVGCECIGFSV